MKHLSFFIFLIFLFPSFVCAENNTLYESVVIGDTKGNWGYPNPYAHYPRGPGYTRMSFLFDSLLWKTNDGIVPALAEKWGYDKRGKKYYFKINDNALWHDGRNVTAEDVKFTIEYYKKHPYGWVDVTDVKAVEVIGENEVVFYMTRPSAPFIENVAASMPILPQHIWEHIENPYHNIQKETFVGSGPFVFESCDPVRGFYHFKRNRNYYLGEVTVDNLIFSKVSNPLIFLLKNRIDISVIQPEMIDILKKNNFKIINSQSSWMKKLLINHNEPPFDNKLFRKAFYLCINREEIVRQAHRGFAEPANPGMLPAQHMYYCQDNNMLKYNPDLAKKLFIEIGYRFENGAMLDGNNKRVVIDFLVSDITAGGESGISRDAEILKKQLEKMGMKINLLHLDQSIIDERVKNRKFTVVLTGHGGIVGDPAFLNRLILCESGSSVNSACYEKNDSLVQLLREQIVEMDFNKRKKILCQVQSILSEDLPSMPLYYLSGYAAYNDENSPAWYYTKGGYSIGIPLPFNKMVCVNNDDKE